MKLISRAEDAFCTPAKAGASAGALTGLAVWALMAFVPAFHAGVPEPVVAVIPVALGWAGHVVGSWIPAHKAAPPAPAGPPVPPGPAAGL